MCDSNHFRVVFPAACVGVVYLVTLYYIAECFKRLCDVEFLYLF